MFKPAVDEIVSRYLGGQSGKVRLYALSASGRIHAPVPYRKIQQPSHLQKKICMRSSLRIPEVSIMIPSGGYICPVGAIWECG